MSDRVAILSGGPVSPDGRHLLILPDDSTELVDPAVTDAELITRHALHSVVRISKVQVHRAVFIDGPCTGNESWVSANKLGDRVQSYLPPRPGGPTVTYEIRKVGKNGEPGELHLIEVNGEQAT